MTLFGAHEVGLVAAFVVEVSLVSVWCLRWVDYFFCGIVFAFAIKTFT